MRNPSCTLCPLHYHATTVCLWGSGHGDLMVIGEAPGAEEDSRGVPFVGRSGRVLDRILSEAGLRRDGVYVTNVVKCRPPQNRTPTNGESRACEVYLAEEIAAADPRMVLLLGRAAYRWACSWKQRPYVISESRGLLPQEILREELKGRRVSVTFHPAYLLRNPGSLPYVIHDLEVLLDLPRPQAVPVPETVNLPPYAVFDVETTGLYPWGKGERILCEGVQYETGPVTVHFPRCGDKQRDLLIGHNVKFDLRWTGDSPRQVMDTKVLAHLVDENTPSLSLESLATTELGLPPWKVDRTRMEDLSPEALREYNTRDVEATHLLLKALLPRVLEQGKRKLMDFEHEVLRAMVDVERAGMAIDPGALIVERGLLRQSLAQLHARMETEVGHTFNPLSTKQVETYLFQTLRLKPRIKTPGGSWSVNEEVLTSLAPDCSFAQDMLTYRKGTKILGSFIEPMSKWVDEKNLIHPTYNTSGTVTGRFSCQEPNIQNVPGKDLSTYRRVFVSRHGKKGVILSADYSQLELRVVAWYSGDPTMCEVFRSGGDIHESTRAFLFGDGTPVDGQRTVAKRVNFGLLYGAGARTLAKTSGLDIHTASSYRTRWFRAYPGVGRWIEDVQATLEEHWSIATPLGRTRSFILAGLSPKDRSHVLSQAVNFPIQSLAADLTKLALLQVHGMLQAHRTGAHVIGQVHDSILVDCPLENLELIRRLVVQSMLDPGTGRFGISFDVPLDVDVKTGRSWYEAS